MVEQAHAEESSGPSIEDADVIVAGGRGLGAPENFTLAEELAKALGGAVGATRAVVDAGWYPYSAQIGQTGKTVSPKLYVALGISGAIQHKVGMQSSNTIVAINKDANAPIFEFSDLGVVGDVHDDRAQADRARSRTRARLMARPSNFPPPFSARDFVAEPTDPADERIEVGVLVVGAGPAGLACAIRLGQLLEEHPEVAERLGDVPVAVLEKGKQPGSHLLSGAVVDPARCRRRCSATASGIDEHARRTARCPASPSTSSRAMPRADPAAAADAQPRQLDLLALPARPLARRARRGGRGDDPARDRGGEAARLARPRRRRAHRRQGPRAATASELGNFEPGADLVAKVTVLAEGTQGHLTGVALDQFGLRGERAAGVGARR